MTSKVLAPSASSSTVTAAAIPRDPHKSLEANTSKEDVKASATSGTEELTNASFAGSHQPPTTKGKGSSKAVFSVPAAVVSNATSSGAPKSTTDSNQANGSKQ